MKAFLISLAVIAGIILIGFVLYLFGFIYAYRNFSGPGPQSQETPGLFRYETSGRVERLENAIQQVALSNQYPYTLKKGYRTMSPALTIFHQGNKIKYLFNIEDCQSIEILAQYKNEWDCHSSYLTITEIELNDTTILYDHAEKIDKNKLKVYKEIFEDTFFTSVMSDLEKQPVYNWKLSNSTIHDTAFALVDIYKANDTNDVQTRHVLVKAPREGADSIYRKLRTEQYSDDSTVITEYNTNSYSTYIIQRSIFKNGKLIRQDH
ncbi:hypothetical protein [Chitinophaga niabensis]|uniref:Uncharacterized protein n=1 Tax=Chitinophaga niabensis TaxID=536979 RepID=A0A1N6K0W6_9BACT|nr:hypothetical protein [Chitinophaga niabensis]SIO50113.1 hypothetical protein SAMN04488055_4839 [Chitinophaga niabensis]